MGDRETRDWVRAVDEVGRAVADQLAAVDRYEARFADVLAGGPPRSSPAEGPGAAELAAAEAGAAEADRGAADLEAAWGRWAEAVSAWRRSVEQPPGPG